MAVVFHGSVQADRCAVFDGDRVIRLQG